MESLSSHLAKSLPVIDDEIRELGGKMRDKTKSLGRAVKANVLVQHRRKQSDLLVAEGVLDSECGLESRRSGGLLSTDGYGFEITVNQEEQDEMMACLKAEHRQVVRWRECLRSHSSNVQKVPKNVVKQLSRQGIPPELRRDVWFELSGAALKRHQARKNAFNYALEAGKLNVTCKHQIDLDTPRTFPNNQWVQSEVGQTSLQRVLYAFVGRNSYIGYCQGMNYVAALLMICMNYDEEAAFWTMCTLIDQDSEGILYHDVYASNLVGCHVEMRSLDKLVEKKLPKLSNHMKVLQCDMSLLATEWFLCLYSTSLPSETAARVWDCLLLEGPKILYRVALALFKIHEPMLLATTNPGELLKAMRSATCSEYNRDELLKVAFDGVGSLSMKQINKYRDEKQRMVDKELAVRNTRERLRTAVMEEGHVLMEGEKDLMEESGHAFGEESRNSQGTGTTIGVDKALMISFQKLIPQRRK